VHGLGGKVTDPPRASPTGSADSAEAVMDPEKLTMCESRALNVNVPCAVGRLGSLGQDADRVPVPDFIMHGLGGKKRATAKVKVRSAGSTGNPAQVAEHVPLPV
jgi:hypothetical protein